jgi:hypothetical protein
VLRATPRSIFSSRFIIRQGGEAVAEVDPGWFGERAEASVAGEPYALARESALGGTFAMRCGGRVVARARKPSAFYRAFEVEVAGRAFELKAVSGWRRELALFEGGRWIGRVAPAGWFGRAAVIDLPEGLPPYARVFLFWLALVLWRRAESASVAAAVSGS